MSQIGRQVDKMYGIERTEIVAGAMEMIPIMEGTRVMKMYHPRTMRVTQELIARALIQTLSQTKHA